MNLKQNTIGLPCHSSISQLLLLILALISMPAAGEKESFSPLGEQGAPADFDALWAGYDPSAEPLETEVLHEWEEDGVVLRVVRFRIGIFKGKKATLAGVYGFPKGKENLPGLLQVHGGGQYADYKAPLYNAKRGYATLSIAWAGRISAPNYTVDPNGVQRYWAGDPNVPGYKRTTDWGAVDGYHAPRRSKIGEFDSDRPGPWTLDAVPSPRNSGWFLATVAARRGLTFLQQQPEINGERLGVYGHSMGGKITVMTTAADKRVKAAAPSCGGISHRDSKHPLYRATLGDDTCLKQISCPIIFLSPSNDFHGRIDDLPRSIEEIKSDAWRVTCSPHLNHRDAGEFASTAMLWFDQYLKQTFSTPKTPETTLQLNPGNGVPTLRVTADPALPIQEVEVYYTQQGKAAGEPEDTNNTKHRFWHSAKVHPTNEGYLANLPLSTIDRPLWVYANVTYKLPEPVAGVGYYYGPYEVNSFTLSSVVHKVEPAKLTDAKCSAALKSSPLIEAFRDNWQKQWFTHSSSGWAMRTNKLNHPLWKAPQGASLVLQARSAEPNKLVIGIDAYAAEIEMVGGQDWQRIELSPNDFKDALGQPMPDWSGARQLRLVPAEHLRGSKDGKRVTRRVGANWKGPDPTFRFIRWLVKDEEDAARAAPSLEFGPSALVDVFPEPTFTSQQPGSFSINADFAPSPGPWMEGMDERDVFRASIKHDQDPLNSFEMRMGVGGQVYSLQGPFGESVPPSWRGNGPTSPWNDEVWQFVAVCSRYNMAREIPEWLKPAAPYKASFFIHNSGCYMEDPAPGSTLNNLYCPLLASGFDKSTRAYRQVNWGMVPQTRSIHRSPILFYTQARDAGDGVIELTWVVHNFSTREDVVFDYLNAPWGGTRVSTLPLTYVATPDGQLSLDAPSKENEGPYRNGQDVRKTGGFTLSTVDENKDSAALALVFGLDKHREAEAQRQKEGQAFVQHRPSVYRSWRAHGRMYQNQWKDFKNIPANSFRNYQVVEFIPRLYIRPQESIWYRTYLVVGGKQRCAELAASLVEHVDYGSLSFQPDNTPMIDLPSVDSETKTQLYAHPAPGTLPVFKLRHQTTGKTVYTTDPYFFTPQKKLELPIPADHKDADYFKNAVGYTLDGQTEFLGLMGFAKKDEPGDTSGWTRLSQASPTFWQGKPTSFHVDVWVKKKDQ